jgi:uracil-DNA glycosylase family protein
MSDEAISAAEFVPDSRSLRTLRDAAADCHGCPLWEDATQTVFGEGPRKARLMLVGEQPGDKEDIEGEPFVGPAGRELDRALEEAGIDRADVYLTNAVKHFKWRPRGKRRLHETPRVGEVMACRPWLEAEIEAVRPVGIVALGATAGRSLFGPKVKVDVDRGALLDSPLAPLVAITAHPSAILRLRDHDEREAARAELVADLRMVAKAAAENDEREAT